jgi:NADH-quinone oxidoreductase subunit L
MAGVGVAWYAYLRNPAFPELVRRRAGALYELLVHKYYFDEFNEKLIAPATRGLGMLLWRVGDIVIIDGALVNGSARLVGWISGVVRQVQTGYLYHYAFAMIIGLSILIGWILLRG